MFDLFFKKPDSQNSTTFPVIIPDGVNAAWPVVYRRMRGAKSLTLRLNPVKRQILLSYPWRTSLREANKFLHAQQDWLQAQMAQTVEPYRLAIGQRVPVLGTLREIIHIPATTRGVKVDMTPDALIVTGSADRVPRAVFRFLKNLAEAEISRLTAIKAAMAERPVRSLTLRDTSSRWGSCTATGDLNFCWRLIMAPLEVIDYVVGHEVAHLVHMHHKPTFWALCRTLTPYTTMGKNWLRQHGLTLQVVLGE